MKVYIVEVWSSEGTEEMEIFKDYFKAWDFGKETTKQDKTWQFQVYEKEIR